MATSEPRPSGLPSAATLKAFAAIDDAHAERVWEVVAREEEHRQRLERHEARMETLAVVLSVVGHLCGLATVAGLSVVSWHFADQGYPVEGAAIIVSGAAAIVATFVGGRWLDRRRQ
jgi:hypothetical protein